MSDLPAPHRLGVLISGRGSNLFAIASAIERGRLPQAKIAVVISNRPEAPGLARAREAGLAAVAIPAQGRSRSEQDAEIVACLRKYRVDLVCLAGYMRLLTPEFVAAFPQRILNIHPSLLPAFAGLHAQRQALEYGVTVSGCTVHFVDEHLDHGPIIVQRTVPVNAGDDERSLSARILEQEHGAYAEAIARVLSGRYRLAGRRYVEVEEAEP